MEKVRSVTVLGITYTVRGATKGELEEALKFSNEYESEDYLVQRCVLSPKIDWETVYAGIPKQLAEHIVELSGASDEASLQYQKEADEWLKTPVGKLEALIMGTMHLKLSDIQNMHAEEWHKSAAAAQLLAATIYNLDVQKYMDLGTARERKTRRTTPNLPPIARA